MAANTIACAACAVPVPIEFWNRESGVRCRGCGQIVSAAVFPAISRHAAGQGAGEIPTAIQAEAEASCFFHPQSRASRACDECGRFLCALCDLEIEGRHICPRCFESGISAHKIETAEPRRTMYDSLALALSTLPALLFWPALICAPWALFIVVRRWNAPSSVVPRTKIRFILAAIFALAEIGFVVFIVYGVTQVILKGPRR